MVDTVVLHVGPYKTGTTALQAALKANSDLLARHGVIYPTTGRSAKCHAPLGQALLSGDTSLLGPLAAEVDGWRAVLISTEHLSALDPVSLAVLRDHFPGAEFRLSYTLRRLADLWPSHWAELVKHGQRLSFSGYLQRITDHDQRPYHAPILPRLQLDRFASVFGEDSLRIGIYDARRAEGQDIGPAFIDDLLGLGQVAPQFQTQPTNVTPREVRTTLDYLMNQHAGDRLDYAAKQQKRMALLRLLNGKHPPAWLLPLEEALARTARIELSQDHPMVHAAQAAVVTKYGAIIQDPIASYLAPIQTSVPQVEALQLDEDLRAILASEFDALALSENDLSG